MRNKVELAEQMLERAFEAGVPAKWVLADSFYGRSHAFRAWLEERGRPYAVMVPKTNAVPLGGRKKKIERLVERLSKGAFSEVHPARDSGGRRPWEWACVDLAPDPKKGMRRWLLVRRSTDDPEDLGFYPRPTGRRRPPWRNWWGRARSAGPLRSASRRPRVRSASGPLRGEEMGLMAPPPHPVPARPRLPGRHPSHRGRRGRKPQKGDLDADLIPPTVPEARKLILAMAAPKSRRRFLLGWSAWRRAHQAVAARSRKASLEAERAARRALGGKVSPKTTAIAPEEANLTDEQWALWCFRYCRRRGAG